MIEYIRYLSRKWKYRHSIGPSMCWYLWNQNPIVEGSYSRLHPPGYKYELYDRNGRQIGTI